MGNEIIEPKLLDKIQDRRRIIVSDSYSMSIGEICSLYVDKEIIINRSFHSWDEKQKSKYIESIFLGIPSNPFFLSQHSNGGWELSTDSLQELSDGFLRLRTLLSFMGKYKEDDLKSSDYFVLSETKLLPELEGFVWNKKISKLTNGDNYLPNEVKMFFKRQKIDLKITKKADHLPRVG